MNPQTNMVELPTLYQQFIHKSRYARWIESENRRESWNETVNRYANFISDHIKFNHHVKDKTTISKIKNAILNLEVMPSMRAMMTAGPSLSRDNICGFNCSYIAMDNQRAFDEILYILMNGTGVGFSVERQFVSKLPAVPDELHETDTTIVVGDSKLGWSKSYKQLIAMLYAGEIPQYDLSKLRPAGARLKTFGGRSSGPAPLDNLFKFTISCFKGAAGRKLTSIEVHDIVCKIGEVVVVGGVRRSALISLSNLSDQRMRDAKSGQWWEHDVQRALANNSVAYTEKPDVGQWMKEWSSIYDSKSGERGIFNRVAAIKQCERFGRDTLINDKEIQFGVNPCGEIILRSMQFCNLSEVVARAWDTPETLKEKVELATIIGTIQSSLTNYKYIRKQWKNNSDEERLLGVSITGIMDCALLNALDEKGRKKKILVLQELRSVAEQTNKKWAKKLGIEESKAICCVKPSGTVSQLVDARSGVHGGHSEDYIRTVRGDVKDPLSQFLVDAGVPSEPDVTKPDDTLVFSFPISCPKGTVMRDDLTAIQQLENWKDYKVHWCHHNPSITVTVKENEWPEVGAWVWDNFDEVGGISFLPHTDHIYQQAPYQACSKDDLKNLSSKMPIKLDWDALKEEDDTTVASQELACVSGFCEIT